jgi:4-carboxymuconolactone decarboxylase
MNEAQRKIYRDLLRTRGGTWFHGPYDPMLHQPRMAEPAQLLGEFVRYHTSLDARLVELAILVVARHWECAFEWYQHAPIAASKGLSAAVIETLRQGAQPAGMDEDETIVFAFTRLLLERHRIPDEDYERARQRFGVVGVVELTGLIGYYTFIAFALNAHEIPLPAGVPAPFDA